MAFFCYVRHFLTDICDFRRGADSVKHPDFQWYLDGALENITHCATTFDFKIEKHLKTKRVLYVANKNLCIYYTQINYFTAMDIETRVHQQVNAMSREQLQHQLIALLVKRETHRYKMAERARDASKKQAFSMASRRYYYKKNDIY